VTLLITDNDGAIATITKNITLTNVPPVADFVWQPTNPTDLDKVQFTSTSYDSDGIIVNYTWNFGDGSVAYGINVTHRFIDDGTYNVTLVITDDDGVTATITKNITIANVPPVADFVWQPTNPTDLDEIIFDAYPSYDSDGKIVKWQWDLGDGNKSSGRIVRHKYAVNGLYKVKLTIVDDDGATVTKTKSIMVSNIPPVANFTWQPTNPTDLDKVLFTSTSYDSDGTIVNYTWQFGDNTTAYGMNVTHLFANDGTYNVTLVIIDDDGAIATITKSIVISNIKPKALFTFSPKHPQEKKKIKFDASMSYDRDGNIVNYTWHFDDGTTAYGIVVYHKFAKKGVYDINLTVTDDDGATNSIISAIEVKEKEKTPGFEFAIIILAIAMLAIMRKRRIGIWRM
ncbi:MAG: PKD domain-containing protein, partial [Thermoplasmata archaeon]